MYVSVTGLKPKDFIGWVRFGLLTKFASRSAQNAPGLVLCDFKSRNGWQHTLTVWENKKHMIAMSFRAIDGRVLIEILPMGKHWLWHSFGAAAVQFLVLYIWRSDLRETGRQACCKV